jgi:general secretion pathway protein K
MRRRIPDTWNASSVARLLTRARGRRGLALVTVLWVLMLLSLVAASFTRTTRTEVNLTRNLIENARAEALADAGAYRAVLGLLAPQTEDLSGEGIESLIRLGAESPTTARQGAEEGPGAGGEAGTPSPEAAFTEAWRVDGTIYAWAFGGGEVRISIQDEGGKIDLNAAPDELLRGLFFAATWIGLDGEAVGLDEAEADALTDAVRDFADPDDLTRLNGAEDGDYEAAGLPWGAKDAPFAAVEELQQVLGMTPPLYEAVAPALTVHTRSKGIDASSAPREALLALPGSEAVAVDLHLAARAEAPKGAGPEFVGAKGFTARSRRRIYTVHTEARAASGAVFAREAVVQLGGREQGFTVLAWKQGRRGLFREDEVSVAAENTAQ